MKMFTKLTYSWLIIFLLAFTQPIWGQNTSRPTLSESADSHKQIKASNVEQPMLYQQKITTNNTVSKQGAVSDIKGGGAGMQKAVASPAASQANSISGQSHDMKTSSVGSGAKVSYPNVEGSNQTNTVQAQANDSKNSSTAHDNVQFQPKPGSGKNIGTPVSIQVNYGGISKPLSELAKEPIDPKNLPASQRGTVTVGESASFSNTGSSESSPIQRNAETQQAIPPGGSSNVVTGPTVSWNGMSNTMSYAPAYVSGDIGPNHYVQTLPTHYQVFNRAGTSLLGPTPITSLFSGTGWSVQPAYAFPIYDKIADRWIFVVHSQAFGPLSVATYVAVSNTPDVLGTYTRYQFIVPDFWDYPGVGLWADGLYLTYNVYPGATTLQNMAVMAINRADLLNAVASPRSTSLTIPLPCTACGYVVPSDLEAPRCPPRVRKTCCSKWPRLKKALVKTG